jgi:LPXTG-motif cell wall-anchored protein
MNVSGGDDSLAPDGLSVAATTGVSEDADQEDEQDEQPPPKAATTSEDQAAPESGGVSVLPDTGGPILLVLLSGLAVAATGLALIRRRR